MMRLPLPVGAAFIALAPFAAHADVGNFRCTFDSDPAVTLQIRIVHAARVEITYPHGVRVPSDAAGPGNVHKWRSNHIPPVRYELDSSRRLAWARVPAANPAALSADEPFNARIHRRAAIPDATPAPQLVALTGRSAVCEGVP